ncbi:anti-sigma factor domain-containing protein [Bacillus sp. SA1-12]|uniref:anti-sigma factor domain-containing protein n=1 Tax=Bacillus sp. SA1-12 TaxID=1455638 RepID=UPI000696A4EB|nr:anti-sigma factor domain-containing protein [Bacillus sp. SA1-12]
MKRGVVVEYNDDLVTLLTPDGQFLKASNKEGIYEIGEEISFFPLMDEREEAASRESRMNQRNFLAYFQSRKVRVGILSVLAIMFFMISFIPFFNQDKVYAYMSIDINPSFEIAIDDNLKVISLEPLNEEAKALIDRLPKWENKHFQVVVDLIVAKSKEKGYVYPGKEIIITTVINNDDSKRNTKLSENIDDIRTSFEHDEIEVKAIESDIDTREKAHQQGISTGKYLELIEKEKAPSDEQARKLNQAEKKAAEQEISETQQKDTPVNSQAPNTKDSTVESNKENNLNNTQDQKNIKKENPSLKNGNINRNNWNNQNKDDKKDKKKAIDDREDEYDNWDHDDDRSENREQEYSDDVKEKNGKNNNKKKEENRDKKHKKNNNKDRDDEEDNDD